jgi:hypothetical protein
VRLGRSKSSRISSRAAIYRGTGLADDGYDGKDERGQADYVKEGERAKMKKHTIRKRDHEKGMILVVAMIVVIAMLIMAMPFLFKLSGQYRSTERGAKALSAFNLAEAGLDNTIWELNYGDIDAWPGDSVQRTQTFPSLQSSDGETIGNVNVVIANPSSDTPTVVSTGFVPFIASNMVNRTVRAELEKGWEPRWHFAVFVEEYLSMQGNAFVDSWNPLVGPYVQGVHGTEGNIGTNATDPGDVLMINNTTVYGDATTGPDSDPASVIRFKNAADITGTTDILSELRNMDPWPTPAMGAYPSRGSLDTGKHNSVQITQSGEYSGFKIGTQSIVSVESPVPGGTVTLYINGDFSMLSGSTFEIAADTKCEIILGDGTWTQASNTTINNVSKDCMNLAILGTESFEGDVMTMYANQDLYAVLYVPKANVTLHANGGIYGAIESNKLFMDSSAMAGGGIHYDERLGTSKEYAMIGDKYIIKTWQEKIGD